MFPWQKGDLNLYTVHYTYSIRMLHTQKVSLASCPYIIQLFSFSSDGMQGTQFLFSTFYIPISCTFLHEALLFQNQMEGALFSSWYPWTMSFPPLGTEKTRSGNRVAKCPERTGTQPFFCPTSSQLSGYWYWWSPQCTRSKKHRDEWLAVMWLKGSLLFAELQ